jgi:hypothetical protein
MPLFSINLYSCNLFRASERNLEGVVDNACLALDDGMDITRL